MNFTDFKYSNGWLNKFKKRRGFSQYIRSGQTADVEDDAEVNGRKKLNVLIEEYKAKDIQNMAESGLFYHLQLKKYFKWTC